ncbi:MAG: hypothetical protein GF404_12830 [candidate division Zixibacteria bacterium]|nr:hypothetical protein [candidate division Zixibacteria bacterium]
MLLKKHSEFFMPLGMVSLIVGILLMRFSPQTSWYGFATGAFLGFSLVMNTATIITLRYRKSCS